jgi:hypothetical protein
MILTKPLLLAQERLDLEDMNVLFESLLADAKFQTKEFWSSNPYVFKGFVVSGLGGSSPVTVDLTDATLINAGNSGDFSWYVAPASPSPISVGLNAGVRNYLELSLSTVNGTPLTKAFWDPSAQGGLGQEFNQTVNTTTSLAISVNVLTGGFSGSTDTVPLAIVDTDINNSVELIIDKRPMFFRLGTTTNPLAGFSWVSQTEPPTTLNLISVTGTFVAGETITIGSVTATVVSGGTNQITAILVSSDAIAAGATVSGQSSLATGTLSTASSSFIGADKSIGNIKDMFSALSNELRAIKGTQFWFSPAIASTGGILNFINSVLAPITSGSSVSWDGSSLSITDSNTSPASNDVVAKIRIFGKSSQIGLSRQDGKAGTSKLAIADGSVLYVQLPSSGSLNFSGAGSASTNYQTATLSAFQPSDQNFWLAYREGSKLIFRGTGELSVNESSPIGDTIPASLLNNIGLADEVTPANYSSNIRGTIGESIVSRVGVLTDAVGDEQEDRSGYLRSDNLVTWDGSNLSFTSDIILEFLNTKSGSVTEHIIPASLSPIAIPSNEAVYAVINRSSTNETLTPIHSLVTAIPAQLQANKDLFVFFKHIDSGGNAYLHIPFMKQILGQGQSVRLGQSGGSGSGNIQVTYYDPNSTSLPTGTSVTVDGVMATNGDTVLYSNLTTGNNQIYTLSGVGSSIVWTPARAFNGAIAPYLGATVIVLKGNAFANQVGEYNGSTYSFNNAVRYFNGSDYWEQSSINTVAISNNTTANVFMINAPGSENIIMDYSIIRGSKKETGRLYITQDGLGNVAFANDAAYINSAGVTFSPSINSGVLVLNYVSDNSGNSGTMKFSIKRWSDAPGGPAGIPSYSGGSGSVASGAAGSTLAIQINGGAGIFAADNRFQINAGANALVLNGLNQEVLSNPFTLLDGQSSPTTIVSFDQNLFPFIVLEYSLRRGGDTQVGRMLITNNGTTASLEDDKVDTAALGVAFTASLSGGQVLLQYMSTTSGFTSIFKYAARKWS